MKHIKIIGFCIYCFALLQQIYPQGTDQSFSKYRLLLFSGERMTVEKGLIKDSTLVDYSDTNSSKEIPLKSIRAMDCHTGTKAMKGLLIGAGIGLVTVAVAILSSRLPYSESDTRGKEGEIFVISTALCAGIGALIGSSSDNWERVPLSTKLNAGVYNGNYQLSVKIIF